MSDYFFNNTQYFSFDTDITKALYAIYDIDPKTRVMEGKYSEIAQHISDNYEKVSLLRLSDIGNGMHGLIKTYNSKDTNDKHVITFRMEKDAIKIIEFHFKGHVGRVSFFDSISNLQNYIYSSNVDEVINYKLKVPNGFNKTYPIEKGFITLKNGPPILETPPTKKIKIIHDKNKEEEPIKQKDEGELINLSDEENHEEKKKEGEVINPKSDMDTENEKFVEGFEKFKKKSDEKEKEPDNMKNTVELLHSGSDNTNAKPDGTSQQFRSIGNEIKKKPKKKK